MIPFWFWFFSTSAILLAIAISGYSVIYLKLAELDRNEINRDKNLRG